MIKRIVEISSPAHLSYRDKQLVIKRNDSPNNRASLNSVPLEDLGFLIVDSQQASYTQRLLIECAIENIAILICDLKHLPAAFLLPIEGNHLHARTVKEQVEVCEPIKKSLWQQLIKAKIQHQADVLENVNADASPLVSLLPKVHSGDPGNVEAQAARMYWPRLFGADFRRDREQSGINSLLNYGYAILRAAVARAVVGTGLYPAFGLKHSNQYNSLCLADDLMEPMRPLVDRTVYKIELETQELPDETPRSSKEKRHAVLHFLTADLVVDSRSFPLIPALELFAASFKEALLSNDKKKLNIPQLLLDTEH